MSFQDFNFHPSIMAGVQTLGYDKPTPIQLQSIPHIMHGRDVIGLAQTGTGKTAAFTLPILQRLLKGQRKPIRAAIISPTRELAGQTCEVINALGKRTCLQSLAIYGGVSMQQQIEQLRSGIDIAVACPGRLIDHLWKGTIGFSNLEVLVIDEADRMFDMGFLPDIRSILRCSLRPRQTLLFSATMPSSIRGLVKDILRDPVTVQIGRTAPATTVSHTLYPVPQQRKTALLIELLHRTETESVLIFTRTKHRAARVAQQLQKTGIAAASLHGNLSQYHRQSVLDSFRTGSSKVLVATDIAARGIDVLHISHVINYDMPESIDAYTHRIGRTGRVNKKGSALTFATVTDSAMVSVLERVLDKLLVRRMMQGFDDAASGPGVKLGRRIRGSRRYALSNH
jgi:ATP-dependent RNA helicase RhlE